MHHRAYAKRIHIGKNPLLSVGEVLVSDITPADTGYLIVDCKAFRMHPAIDAVEIQQEIERLEVSVSKRIENADFEIAVAGQPAQFAVEAGNAVIVNQQTDPYTPRCRSAQVFQQEITGQIVAPDVILQVDRSFGRGDESRADGKRVYAVLDKCNARQAGMAHRVLSDT